MIFKESKLKGVFTIEIEKKEDERGFFARIWDKDALKSHGLSNKLLQASISFSIMKGTLRGLHYQKYPYGEDKLVRVSRGSAYYAIVDLRKKSPTYKENFGVILSSKNYLMLYVPKGFASGFMTLEDNTELIYQMSQPYVPDAAFGLKWDDPTIAIKWPLKPVMISEKDKNLPYFR
ncbi:MAG TPA: dTDP-4-dehydrorhamnose 3,5-epimerase [Anaerovoracaceae bacterium]|nr:dTDP-4-dehydrorhamnose 3,5-epimerase [Anaerovoracaceae bacterium]